MEKKRNGKSLQNPWKSSTLTFQQNLNKISALISKPALIVSQNPGKQNKTSKTTSLFKDKVTTKNLQKRQNLNCPLYLKTKNYSQIYQTQNLPSLSSGNLDSTFFFGKVNLSPPFRKPANLSYKAMLKLTQKLLSIQIRSLKKLTLFKFKPLPAFTKLCCSPSKNLNLDYYHPFMLKLTTLAFPSVLCKNLQSPNFSTPLTSI